MATLWHLQDVYRWREDGAQLQRLRDSQELRLREHALFARIIEAGRQLADEHVRLRQTLHGLFVSEPTRGVCCELRMDTIVQIVTLVETKIHDEGDRGLELTELRRCVPSAVSTPKAFRNCRTRSFEMTLEGRYQTLVHLLRRLGAFEPDRLVVFSRLRLSPRTSRWDGTWTARLVLTEYLQVPQ